MKAKRPKSAVPASADAPPPVSPAARPSAFAAPLAAALLTALASLPVLRNKFAWDDDINILQNYHFRGLHGSNLRWIFSGSFGNLGNYEPVTWLAMALIHQLGGMNPRAYHLAGLLLHSAAAAALCAVGLRLLRLATPDWSEADEARGRVCAAAAALFFSLNPLRVEASGWVSGQHHVMSALFFLGSTGAYLSAREAGGPAARRLWTAASVACYALSMLSMPVPMGLPLVLLVLDAYPLRRIDLGRREGRLRRAWELLWEKLPWLAAGAAFAAVAFLARSTRGAMTSLEEYGAAPRLAQAVFGLAFYLYKTLAPVNLMALYELRTDIKLTDPKILSSAAFVASLAALLWAKRRQWPAALAAAAFYLIILAPVLGFSQSGHQIAADRYTYISCMGWSLLAGGVLFSWWRGPTAQDGPKLWGALAAAALWLAVLGALTWKQAQVWEDGESLWRHAIAVDPGMAGAHSNLGMALTDKKRYDEAIAAYNDELKISPSSSFAFNNLGNAYALKGELEKSIPYFKKALEIEPRYAQGWVNLGNALDDMGRREEALESYRKALGLAPRNLAAHYNLGITLLKMGRYRQAREELEGVAGVNPEYESVQAELAQARRFEASAPADSAESENTAGEALARSGRMAEALGHFERALRLDPKNAAALNNLGNVHLSRGDAAGAAARYRQALKIRDTPSYHNNLGAALARQGRLSDALAEFRAALQADPDQENARVNLADALVSLGRQGEAKKELEEALARRPANPRLQQALRRLNAAPQP